VILHPFNPPIIPSTKDCKPVWEAILATQKQSANEWLLITQADHASLAGEMARSLVSPDFPALNSEIIQAISVHDDGWKQVDNPEVPHTSKQGRPLSFFEEVPADIFRAWQGSINGQHKMLPSAEFL